MKLYGYFRSSAAYRVRIALNLKKVQAEQIPVSLLLGDQKAEHYTTVNPQGLVPALATEQGVLGQSLAMLEWLEASYPTPTLLPGDVWQQAQIRAFALSIACDIHPLNNLRVLKYLTGELGLSEAQKNTWYQHWIETGFSALEQQVGGGKFCFGANPSMADVCLIPQMYNARRFKIDLADYPKLCAIEARCNALPAFTEAAPENQPDAQA